ncbi:MAG: hypothetical protein VX899_24750 [Myxococcota bacterium]|nr:hypothetical protein [Myxococcota bacterium]
MSLIGKIVADALTTRKGIVEGQSKRIQDECVKLGLPKPQVRVYKVGTGEKKVRYNEVVPNGALRCEVDLGFGEMQITMPFTDKVAMPTQFRMDFPFDAPASVVLTRGFLGVGSWEAHDVQEDLPEVKAFFDRLGEISGRLSDDIELRHELPGNTHIDLGWGMQILQTGAGRCTAIIQTGGVGIFTTVPGVEVAKVSFQALRDLLAGYSGQIAPQGGPHAYALAMVGDHELELDPAFSGGQAQADAPPAAEPDSPTSSAPMGAQSGGRPEPQGVVQDPADFKIRPKTDWSPEPPPAAGAPSPGPRGEPPEPAAPAKKGMGVLGWSFLIGGGLMALSCAGCMGLGMLGAILENAGY